MITADAIKKSSESDQIPLKWVGMEKISLPVTLSLEETKRLLAGEFNVFVNLTKPSKGIHMSRLYEILSDFTAKKTLTLNGLRGLLETMIVSQQGISSSAKIVLSLNFPVAVKTLMSEKNYFKSVPTQFEFLLEKSILTTNIKFQLDYSSTCPQSAGLALQLTIQELEKLKNFTGAELTDWYQKRGLIATPHAQRSELDLKIQVGEDFELSDFPNLFLQLGTSLGTPTQGIVKRIDEQQFAKLNADHLMFCEDAARKIIVFLKQYPLVKGGQGKVTHLESLHSHNAVSYFEF